MSNTTNALEAGIESLGLEQPKDSEPYSLKKDLDQPTTEEEASESESDSEDGYYKPSITKEDKNSNVVYSVEYLDKGGTIITRQPWKGPFDLAEARKGVKQKQIPVFEIVAVLETSLRPERYYSEWEVRNILKQGILENPDIKVLQNRTKLIINSVELMTVMRRIVKYYSIDFEAPIVEIMEPYMFIGHYLEDFRRYLKLNQKDSQTIGIQHLRLLLDIYYHSGHQKKVEEEQIRHSQLTCTCETLWLLYKPGTTVYCETNGKIQAYVIRSVRARVNRNPLNNELKSSYEVKLWNLQFDGRFVGRCSKTIEIANFEGERKISSLKIIPCDFIDRQDDGITRKTLEDEGEKWFKLLHGRQMDYAGELLDAGGKEFHGRVYVDSTSYYDLHKKDKPDIYNADGTDVSDDSSSDYNDDISSDYDDDVSSDYDDDVSSDYDDDVSSDYDDEYMPDIYDTNDFLWACYDIIDPVKESSLELQGSDKMSRHRYLLCDRRLFGFDLKSRNWMNLDVAHCKLPNINEKAIDTLVMPLERKNMIKALIQRFTNETPEKGRWAADFIENKGEGQIFLLHGSPGVGKTFTAECIAEHTRRPLMSLACGDIGIDENKMETQLMKWFKLAEKWSAVLLIDEADVFLEQRHVADIKRNSLVSVFLRVIEYYRGIMFLTTNRVSQFDDAFISRIHVIIYYDKLSSDYQKKIWKQFFDKLTNDRPDFLISEEAKNFILHDTRITNIGWNGREIRNAFQTAVALAHYRFLQKPDKTEEDGPTLEQRDIEQVSHMIHEFKSYLTNVRGIDEDRGAFTQDYGTD
ncbi:hypothetical protein V8C40DRAFT_280165 [Trichoderma camerunense]